MLSQELPSAVVVRPGGLLIGTQTQCHLRLSDPGVGELHCAVVGRRGRYFLRNFAGGVRLNGRCVRGEMELRDRDGIDVGTARLEFLHDHGDHPAQVRRLPATTATAVAPPPAMPRRTRVTQVVKKSVLNPAAPPRREAALAGPVARPVRKTRVTQVLRQGDLLGEAEVPAPVPTAPAPVDTPQEEAAAALLLTESEAAAPHPAGGQTAAVPTADAGALLAGLKGVPAYAVAMGGQPGEERRPMLRLIVGRKDRVQPLLRKWELEGARIAAQHRPPGRPGLRIHPRWFGAGLAVLLMLGLGGGYFLGRPRSWPTTNPHAIAITIDQWERLSDAEQNDPDNISAVSNHIRTGAAADRPPAEPRDPGPDRSGSDPNI